MCVCVLIPDILGLTPLIFSMMGLSSAPGKDDRPRLELVGPLGLRAFLRTTLSITYATLNSCFVVHELLWPSQPAYPHHPSGSFIYTEEDIYLPPDVRGQTRTLPCMPPHANELPGRDIRMDESTGTWPRILQLGNVWISAAPITHRCPTVGYVFEEAPTASKSVSPRDLAILDSNAEELFDLYQIRHPRSLLSGVLKARETLTLPDGHVLVPPPLDRPGRKLCILGDTSDATAGLEDKGMLALARDADLLVHECTYAYMREKDVLAAPSPEHAQLLQQLLLAEGEAEPRALSRGHSVPRIAGSFAGLIRARHVVFNHFSARLPAPHTMSHAPLTSTDQLRPDARLAESEQWFHVMREIERQVTEFWHAFLPEDVRAHMGDRRAVAAYDGLAYILPPLSP